MVLLAVLLVATAEGLARSNAVKNLLLGLANAVAAAAMAIPQGPRGEDNVNGPPKYLLTQAAMGAPRPTFAHLPILVDEQRKKLSKRKHAVAVADCHASRPADGDGALGHRRPRARERGDHGARAPARLARALGGRPQVVIADEITSALDVSSQQAVARLLVEFRDRGFVNSVIFITHDISILYQIADTITVMCGHQLPFLSCLIPCYMVKAMCTCRQPLPVWPAGALAGASFPHSHPRILTPRTDAPRAPAPSRSPVMEADATNRVIRLAEVAGVPVYIVHLSSRHALNEVRRARDEGLPAFAETCPQYLFLSLDDLAKPDFEGSKYVCSPPLRPTEHQGALWRGLRTNDLSIVSTDHCPFCMKEQKELGRDDFTKIPNGAPGVENRVPLIYNGGVVENRISLNRFVELTSTAAAKMFGLFPKKGTIAVGSDADIVIFDPEKEQTLGLKTSHMNVDYNPYEGRACRGAVETVLSRGEVIIEKGRLLGKPGRGEYIVRKGR